MGGMEELKRGAELQEEVDNRNTEETGTAGFSCATCFLAPTEKVVHRLEKERENKGRSRKEDTVGVRQ